MPEILGRAGTAYVEVRGDFSHLHRDIAQQTRGMGSHGSKLGRALSTGLKVGAGGAAVALGGLAVAAKKSVEAFAEAERVGAQTNAVLKSTRHEAGLTAKEVAHLATQISRKSGINDEAIQSGENLLLTFTNLRNEQGKGNDIFTRTTRIMADMSVALGQDTKSSAIQLGKALNDPIKGITALRRVGVSFTQQQTDQIKTLVESGKTLEAQKLILRELNKEFGGSAKAAGDTFQGSINKAKVEVGNLGEELGSVLAPALKRATDRFTGFVTEMETGKGAGGRFAEDLKHGVKDAEGHIKGLVGRFHQLRGEGESVGGALGTMVSDGFGKAVPAIAESVAEHAPKIAGAFVRAFAGANVWGKLAIGGFLLSKFGGLGSLSRIGATAGGTVAGGFRERFKSRLGGLAKGIGLASLVSGLSTAAAEGGKLSDHLQNFASGATFNLVPTAAVGRMRAAAELIGKMREQLKGFGSEGNSAAFKQSADTIRKLAGTKIGKDWFDRGQLQAAGKAFDHTAARIDAMKDSFSRMRKGSVTNMGELRRSVSSNFQTIQDVMGAKSKKGAEAVSRNTSGAVKSIKRFMKDGTLTAKQGMAEIQRVFVAEMKLYGISGNQANADANRRAYDLTHGVQNRPGNERGGMHWFGKPGQVGHDSIPATIGEQRVAVAPGEVAAVFNRHQLPEANARFAAEGGLAGFFEKYRKPHHMAIGGLAPGINRAAQAVLRRFPGLSVTSTYRPGDPGYHGRHQAVDVASGDYAYMNRAASWVGRAMPGLTEGIHNPNLSIKNGQRVPSSFWGPGTWAGHANHIHMAVAGALGRIKAGVGTAADVKLVRRVLVSGPDSPLKSILQGSLDTTRKAANRKLRDIAGFAKGGIADPERSAFNRVWSSARSFFPNAPGHYPGRLKMKDTGFVAWATNAGKQHANDPKGEFWIPRALLHTLITGEVDKSGWGLDRTTVGKLLVHEMAHSQQDPRATNSMWKSEGGAEAFARAHAPAILSGAGFPYNSKGARDSFGDPYRPFMQRVRKTLGQKWIDRGQFGFARGGIVGMARGGIAGLNHLFPRHGAGQRGEQLSPGQVNALARSVGFDSASAKHMTEIAHGESTYFPGVVSSDQGYGLWQMTPRVWGAGSPRMKRLQQLGGIGQMLNPVKNALMARFLFRERRYADWVGTRYLSGTGGGLGGDVNIPGGSGGGGDSSTGHGPGIRGGERGEWRGASAASPPWTPVGQSFGPSPSRFGHGAPHPPGTRSPGAKRPPAGTHMTGYDPFNPPERPDIPDALSAVLSDIDLHEQAGDITPAEAQAQRSAAYSWALGGGFGVLTPHQQLAVRAAANQNKPAATETGATGDTDLVQAIKDLKASIDQQNAQHSAVQAIGEKTALDMLTGLISGRIGAKVNQRQAVRTFGSVARV